ncbi:D-amino-acid transaminase [Sandarakinorhabdus limnophila]|uniref:D-amino-acid transaminase n=1 Tax=Sandarakinorhabdus limnophila TaxID=210512 RepID=UPI0026EE2E02|nr:D-amino-acid transaminase [Sandarakinorhabdus limnophila]MCM0032220.1 D-amino-acid transaminase [Sandarakinorhabdus limnophila]
MPQLAYVNGRIGPLADASLHIEDRGTQFGDAVYEVCAVMNGRILDWQPHLVRLRRNLAELGIVLDIADGPLTLQARRLIAANGYVECIIYMQVSRGTAKRDHAFPGAAPANLVMTVRRFDFAQRLRQLETGIGVITQPDNRWGRVDIKTTGLLPNVLAKQAAKQAGAFEAWLVSDQTVREGSSTNAWIVKDGRIITHPTGTAILPGIARDSLIRLAHAAQLVVEERPFTLAEAMAADEAFLTSTTAPILPVVRIDGTAVGSGSTGPVVRRLAELVWNEVARQTGWRA